MINVPNYMPVLSAGKHSKPSEGACIMEYASFLAGEKWSDTPSCTHPVLALTAQWINDNLSDDDRHVLLPLLPRLMGTSVGKDDHVLSVRLAVWAARRVAHLSTDPRIMNAIKAAEAWIESPNDTAAESACEAYSAHGYSSAFPYAATYAAYATAFAVTCELRNATRASAAAAVAAAETYGDSAERIKFLSDLITEYDRLTGRVEHPTVTEDDLRRCAELTA